MKNKLTFLFMTLIPLLLTGCWDKVELEGRGLVITLGIDKYSPGADTETGSITTGRNRYRVSAAIPNVAALTQKSGGGEGKNKSVKSETGETVSGAMRLIDSHSSQSLYFGHTRVLVLGESLLNDADLLSEALDALERNREINRKIILLSAEDDAKQVLEGEPAGEPMVGMFVENYYKNNVGNSSLTFKQDLENAVRGLRSSDCILIPKITRKDKDASLGGAAVIKDFKLTGWLDDTQTRGYLWVKGQCGNAVVCTEIAGTSIPLRVTKCKSSLKFDETVGRLLCGIDVSVEGNIEEYLFSKEVSDDETLWLLTVGYEDIIAGEIADTIELFHNVYSADGFGLKDTLRKKNYDLYKKYENDWDTSLADMLVSINTTVKIKGTGAIE